jgi:pimeloyl-ACP methyl ester carboxylesterase
MANFVLVHGAFHGGWCWSRVAAALRRGGHTVFTPTQTGLADRRHLLTRHITLDTFVDDVCLTIEAEELADIVLVGHSFGGISITGAADRMPERIRHLVYLDARILEAGQSMLDVDAARSSAWRDAAERTSGGVSIPTPPAEYFGVPDPDDVAWIARRLTPHPLGTFTSPLTLAQPRVGNGIPCTYVVCMKPVYPWLASCRDWARGRDGWTWAEIAAGHDAMVSEPVLLAKLLTEIAA